MPRSTLHGGLKPVAASTGKFNGPWVKGNVSRKLNYQYFLHKNESQLILLDFSLYTGCGRIVDVEHLFEIPEKSSYI
jgi:hypothetical protein